MQASVYLREGEVPQEHGEVAAEQLGVLYLLNRLQGPHQPHVPQLTVHAHGCEDRRERGESREGWARSRVMIKVGEGRNYAQMISSILAYRKNSCMRFFWDR